MLGKTKLQNYIENGENTFYYASIKYNNIFINDNLRQIIVNTGSILYPTYRDVGIYNIQKHAFVLDNLGKSGLLNFGYITDIDEYQNLNDLKNELMNLIMEEFKNIIKYESHRSIKNDKTDKTYQLKIKKMAEDYYKNGEMPNVEKLNITGFNHTMIKEKDLINALQDINDTAYMIVEDFIDKNPDYLYSYYLNKDIVEEINKLKKDNTNEFAAIAKINEICNTTEIKTVMIEVEQLNSYNNIEYNKKLSINTKDLSKLPIEIINSISWKKKKIYDKSDYKISNDINCWFKNSLINKKYTIDDFLPNRILNDLDSLNAIAIHREINTNYIPKTFLQKKSNILKFMTYPVTNKINIFIKLDKNFQTDVDVIYHLLTNNASFDLSWMYNKIPDEILNEDNFQLVAVNKNDYKLLMYLLERNCLNLNNSTIYNIIINNMINKVYDSQLFKHQTYSDRLLSKITDIDVIIQLLKNNKISNFNILQMSILNDERFWKAVNLNKSIITFMKVRDLDKKIIENDECLFKIFQLMYQDCFLTIETTIGFDEFKKRENLQRLLLTECDLYLEFVNPDICEEYLINNINNLSNRTLKIIFNREDLVLDDLIEKFIKHDVKNMEIITYILGYNNNTVKYKISESLLKKLFNKYPNCIKYVVYGFFVKYPQYAKLASNYDSIIQIISGKYKADLQFDKDLILNCLSKKFSDFLYLEKPSAYHNYKSLLIDDGFIETIFKLDKSDEDAINAVNKLLKIKSPVLKNEKVLKSILIHNFECITCFKRTVYNNKSLIFDVIKNTKEEKNKILKLLTTLNSKLIKDEEIIDILT